MALEKITTFARPFSSFHTALLEMRWCLAGNPSDQWAATKRMAVGGHIYLLLSVSEGARKYSICLARNTIEATG